MQTERIANVTGRLEAIATEIDALRQTVEAEPLSVSDRQYLARCFDLLDMELRALRQYLDGLNDRFPGGER